MASKLSKTEAAAIRANAPTATEAKPEVIAKAKPAKVVDPQVAKAKADLKAAHEAAKAAEAKAKEQRKADREAKAAERKAAKAEPRPTCTGTKKDGTACTAKAKEGSQLCVDHQPAILRLTGDEQKALRGWLGSMNREQLTAAFVNEVGWFRAKQIVAESNPVQKPEPVQGQGQVKETAVGA